MTDTKSTKSDSKGQKDPLAVLENILSEAKQKGQVEPGKASAKAKTGPSVEEQAKLEAELKAEEEHKKQLEAERVAVMEAERLELIEAQKRKLEIELKQTPQYQARVQQDVDKKEEQAKHKSFGEGYEIRQLGHTKI